ncbi:MAG: tRNA (5-methylaminomethyl-2-thiouridylate)-methyltransferase [Gammaproteobacteria bacterium]|nr:tRNA (5-methylaminomethyl-2-thiouridylate)-methyltransferase [Gammaproteobacteria bacterium]
MTTQRKAIALISGGLDSLLAARVIQEQGIHVEGINFYTGFCVEGHTHAIRRHANPKRNNALWVAEQLDIKLHIIDIVDAYKQVLLNPRYGYGKNLNPCMDCKIFMLDKAREWLEEHGFDFIITGEVMGQRPNSQLKHKLPVIAARSQTKDILLRPLSAKYLRQTLPEREGWVDREQLFDFNGRSRKPQMALAARYGFTDYAQPAGGCCFLTDEHYTAKLNDLWQARRQRDYTLDDIILLKVGRHIRPRPGFKLIVGREEGENNFLEGYRNQFAHLRILDYAGPLTLVDGEATEDDLLLAARIAARYSKGRDAVKVKVTINDRLNGERIVEVAPMPPDEIPAAWQV